MPKFRKKPIVIEAIQWEGSNESWDKIMANDRLEYLKKKLDHCQGRIHDAETEDREIRKIICDEFSKFKVNDMVVVIDRNADGTEYRRKRGKIFEVDYSPKLMYALNGFVYVIRSVRKDGSMADRPHMIHYSSIDTIEKFEEDDE